MRSNLNPPTPAEMAMYIERARQQRSEALAASGRWFVSAIGSLVRVIVRPHRHAAVGTAKAA
jgi:hypothetical protein